MADFRALAAAIVDGGYRPADFVGLDRAQTSVRIRAGTAAHTNLITSFYQAHHLVGAIHADDGGDAAPPPLLWGDLVNMVAAAAHHTHHGVVNHSFIPSCRTGKARVWAKGDPLRSTRTAKRCARDTRNSGGIKASSAPEPAATGWPP